MTGQSIKIGDDITVTVTSIRNGQAKIGIAAPPDIPVHREEIYDRVHIEEGPTPTFSKRHKPDEIIESIFDTDPKKTLSLSKYKDSDGNN